MISQIRYEKIGSAKMTGMTEMRRALNPGHLNGLTGCRAAGTPDGETRFSCSGRDKLPLAYAVKQTGELRSQAQ